MEAALVKARLIVPLTLGGNFGVAGQMSHQVIFIASISPQPLSQSDLHHLARISRQMANLIKQFPVNFNGNIDLIGR
jgi:hypothetical protein